VSAMGSAQTEKRARAQGIFALIRAQWRDIALIFAAIVALGVFYLHIAERQYTVSATLAPSDAELSMLTGVSGMTELGSLSLGRIGLGLGTSDPKFSAFLQQLTSNATARALLADDRVKAAVYETTWDARTRSFHPPSGPYAEVVQLLKAALGLNPWHAPTAADMQLYLSHNVVPKEIGISELYSVSYSNKDPEFARYFLSRVLAISDNYLKQQKLARATAYVRYLDQKLQSITDVDQRQAMLRLRLQQENFLMAASVNLPFSADINDPPITPSRPTWPNPLILGVIILVFGGGLAAAMGVYFRPYEAISRRFANRSAPRSAMTATGRVGD
jgi:LPS O-antigen subunit length determinant protein (WzzB/FepE family)